MPGRLLASEQIASVMEEQLHQERVGRAELEDAPLVERRQCGRSASISIDAIDERAVVCDMRVAQRASRTCDRAAGTAADASAPRSRSGRERTLSKPLKLVAAPSSSPPRSPSHVQAIVRRRGCHRPRRSACGCAAKRIPVHLVVPHGIVGSWWLGPRGTAPDRRSVSAPSAAAVMERRRTTGAGEAEQSRRSDGEADGDDLVGMTRPGPRARTSRCRRDIASSRCRGQIQVASMAPRRRRRDRRRDGDRPAAGTTGVKGPSIFLAS